MVSDAIYCCCCRRRYYFQPIVKLKRVKFRLMLEEAAAAVQARRSNQTSHVLRAPERDPADVFGENIDSFSAAQSAVITKESQRNDNSAY